MRGRYIVVGVLVLTCGAGAASWRAASQISQRIQAATHLAVMAQLAAEERAKAAEIALGVSDAAERFARAELVLERNMREYGEQALDSAIGRSAQTARTLTGLISTANNFEGDLSDSERDLKITQEQLVGVLARHGTAKKNVEAKLEDIDTILHLVDAVLVKQAEGRRDMQAELDNAKVLVRELSWQLQQARIKAEVKAQASAGNGPAAVKGREIASNKRQAVKRRASNSAQEPAGEVLLPAKKPQASWQQSSAP